MNRDKKQKKFNAKRFVNKQHELNDTYDRIAYLERFEDDFYILAEKYDALFRFLKDFLQNTVGITCESEKSIREQISRLLIANAQPIDSIILDKYGYIKEIKQANLLVKHQDYPQDILWGYYKVEDGKIVLDEQRKMKRYEVL